jgi:hypothetical protein
MKKIFLLLAIANFIATSSCDVKLTEETVDSASIIGEPIKVGNLLVDQNDFTNKIKRKDAKKA